MIPDSQLLSDYVRAKSQDAFTQLVRRHLDLVYSAALRQVRSPQLAEDVSQSVFADLARAAKTFKPDTILTAWLYQVTRRTAIDVVRRESRRQARERLAVEMAAMTTAADWTHIEPLLDDAMENLDETDRAAILLRYFENKSLREVGQRLGTSDDAAQKRVSRAVERLREFFSKRGVAIGASGLFVVISANAVHAAPLALATTISTAAALAGTTIHTSTAIAATKAIAMTALQKTVIGGVLTVAIAGSIFEGRQAAALRAQNQTLQKQHTTSAAKAPELQQKYDDLSDKLATLTEENQRLKTNADELLRLRAEVARLKSGSNVSETPNDGTGTDKTETMAKSWMGKVDLLKNYLSQNPNEAIPEVALLNTRDWLNSADPSAWYWNLANDKDYRDAMTVLRDQAEMRLQNQVGEALRKFAGANNHAFPTDFAQLQPYGDPQVMAILAQEYEIASATDIPAAVLPNDAQLGAENVIRRKTAINQRSDRMTIVQLKRNNSTFYQTLFY